MDEFIKQVAQKTIDGIEASLQNSNYEHSGTIPANLIDLSLMVESKIGVFIGEVLESALTQFLMAFKKYEIPDNERPHHIGNILMLINDLRKDIGSEDDQVIYGALSSLRFYVTQQQKSFPLQYKELKRRQLF